MIGVAAFFVISGFVMTYSQGEHFGKSGAPLHFAARRFARIVPFYWIITIIHVASLMHKHEAPPVDHLVRSLALMPYASNGLPYGFPLLGQAWTLSYEALFYTVFGLALFVRWGMPLVIGVFILLPLLHLAGLLGRDNPLAFWSAPITLYFLAGMALALVRRRRGARPTWGFYPAVGAAAALLALAAGGDILMGPGTLAAGILRAVVAVGAVGVCALACERQAVDVPRKAANALGDATYSIYLTHVFVIDLAATVVARWTREPPVGLFVAGMLVLACAAGILVNVFGERPLTGGLAFMSACRRNWTAMARSRGVDRSGSTRSAPSPSQRS
jgi:peptidoglycan/LPS O-acetylase OafA/YrhL